MWKESGENDLKSLKKCKQIHVQCVNHSLCLSHTHTHAHTHTDENTHTQSCVLRKQLCFAVSKLFLSAAPSAAHHINSHSFLSFSLSLLSPPPLSVFLHSLHLFSLSTLMQATGCPVHRSAQKRFTRSCSAAGSTSLRIGPSSPTFRRSWPQSRKSSPGEGGG